MTEKIISIPLDPQYLHDSPSNPRTTFNPAKLAELAESIKSQGLLQPVVVRPLLPEGSDGYELVFGHRRVRAARLAGMEFVPAILRDMMDEQVAVAQIHENLEREDVNPIEEAEGFRALMHRHGVTAQQLMADTGKSKSYIYGRLKLLELAPIVRQACAEEALPADVAIKIARLPKAVQAKALDLVSTHDFAGSKPKRDGWLSQRQALKELDRCAFFEDITKARFDLHDESLPPRACSQCEHCSLTDPAAEEGSAVTCTMPECFEKKEDAHTQREIEAHRAAGTLIEASEGDRLYYSVTYGPVSPPYVATRRPLGEKRINDFLRAMPEADRPQTKLMLTTHSGQIEVISFDDLAAVHAAAGLPAPVDPSSRGQQAGQGGASDDSDDDNDNAPSAPGVLPLPLTEEETAARNNWMRIRAAIMRRVASTPRSTDELRLIVAALAEHLYEIPDDVREAAGWTVSLTEIDGYGDDVTWLISRLPEMTADELATSAILFALVSSPIVGDVRDEPAAMVKLARTYGISPLDPEADPLSTPSPAPRGKEVAKTAAKLPPGVKYRDPATGQTWSGRGLKPKWLTVALADGKTLSDFALQVDLVDQQQKDDAGVAAGGSDAEVAHQ